MCSSGRQGRAFPDWSLFTEREVPSGDEEIISPAAELGSVLRWARAEIDVGVARQNEVRAEGIRVLAQQAVFVFQLAGALDAYRSELPPRIHRHLRVLKEQMQDALRHAGIESVNSLGVPFDEIASAADVIGWRHHERFSMEVVAEVIEPIVTCGGAVVRPGRVIMGAPPEQAAESTVPNQPGDSATQLKE